MNRKAFLFWYIPILLLVTLLAIVSACIFNQLAKEASGEMTFKNRTCIVIDAGHGGVDGGATSCTGALESGINLDISIRLDDLLHLMGYETKMIRTADLSVHTEGTTIAQKKISDLKERVRIANSTPNALLVSIHQNMFQDAKYSGAQVFYASTPKSETLAKALQSSLGAALLPGNKRQAKPSSGVYLMERIQCTGVLIECGFLSNPVEESLLRNTEYQKKLCAAIAATLSVYLDRKNIN